MIVQNCACVTIIGDVLDPKHLSLVCIDDVLFNDVCSGTDERQRATELVSEAIAEVETFLDRSLLIDLYTQDLCDCFCDCCNTYVWADHFPVHALIEGVSVGQTPIISTRESADKLMTGGQRIKVSGCCGHIEYYAGYAPCGATLEQVNAMLYAKYPTYGNAQLMNLPPQIPSDIRGVIVDIVRYKLRLERENMIGIQTREETNAKGDVKRTTIYKGYIRERLSSIIRHRKL